MVMILVVEDTASERELICSYLQAAGHQTIAAENGKQALTKIEQQIPDVIITDLVMPDMSGLELCRHIKKNALAKAVPIIACTSKSTDLDKLWGLKQGINIYLTKPFTREDILEAVRSLTGGKS
jgi:two-component system, chemotaxis family, response regulator PixH